MKSVKPQLLFQGGNVFGKAKTDPKNDAATVLRNMICSMFGGKKLFKVFPVFGLHVNFRYG